MKPVVYITYCPKCGWLLRATWMAQELLTTFTEELQGVQLQPSEINGAYKIYVNDTLIWDRKREQGFPDIKVLKRLVRDIAAPGKPLGHSEG
ncbi:selenoprotein W-related protein [Chitinophaga costaii]|uniref:Selenoprotein W-related protein n=1 Tax=Chitinophaga costaii TaxID=1335309 RepID=A0A1C4FE92_9BACT|nr:SelT/SelW/SelH family protein [Chitinophaga costaii]PUZ20641.1 SelT/SelW/SelH family protein [Chitinophaga costaii]SCC54220.1 selenoprotein W-related protein [Chitinophaga costaii]